LQNYDEPLLQQYGHHQAALQNGFLVQNQGALVSTPTKYYFYLSPRNNHSLPVALLRSTAITGCSFKSIRVPVLVWSVQTNDDFAHWRSFK
jgi:hypothetical protein